MKKRRQISPLDVEPTAQCSLSRLEDLTSPIAGDAAFQDLLGERYADLHSTALLAEARGKVVKAAKSVLTFLSQAEMRIPGLLRHWKKQTALVFGSLEGTAVRLIREEKVKSAGKLLRAMDTAVEAGLKLDQSKWHRVRLLHLYRYIETCVQRPDS